MRLRRGRVTVSQLNSLSRGDLLVLPAQAWDGDDGPPGHLEHAVVYDETAGLEWDVSVGDVTDNGKTVFLNVHRGTERPIAGGDPVADQVAFENYRASLAAERARREGGA